MRFLLLTLCLMLPALAFAEGNQPKHIFTIGTDGFGWSGLATTFDWDKEKSGIEENTYSEGNLKLNYSYVFPNRLMLGAEIMVKSEESESKDTAGDKETSEESTTEFGISLGYNFNEDIYNSWWLKGTLGSGSYESKEEDSTSTTEVEYGYTAFTLSFGKRISLDSWGLKNFSYNPSIAFTSGTVSGDAEDAGLDKFTHLKLEIIKFDILF